MNQVVARQALCHRVIRVDAGQRPPSDQPEDQPPGTLYAVFTGGDAATGAPGEFLGIVSALMAAHYPMRIFADLVTRWPVEGIAAETPLEEVLHHLDGRRIDAAPVLGATGEFIGVVTRTSLLYALFNRTRQLNTALDRDRGRLQQWSRSIERLNDSLGELFRVLWHAADERDLLERGLRALARLLDIEPVAIGYARAGGEPAAADCFQHPLQRTGKPSPCLGCMRTAAAGRETEDGDRACALETRPIRIHIADAAGDFGYGLLCPRARTALEQDQELIAANYARALSFALSTVRARDQRLRLLTENRNLARRLVDVQEQERKRLAQELHDELGQCLTAIRADAELIAARTAGRDALVDASAAAITAVAARAYDAARGLMYSLRPPALDQSGLRQALEEALHDWRRRFPAIAWHLDIEAGIVAPSDAVAINLYRLIQEAVTNICRHAHARRVQVNLRRGPPFAACAAACAGTGLLIHIEDDGRGMEPAAATDGLGLVGMRERLLALGGCFRLDSVPGAGTSLNGWVPLHGDAACE